MKVLVTGGTGFVGKHLIVRLIENQHKVDCWIRHGCDTSFVSKYCDKLYTAITPEEIRQYDVIYHLAGVLGKAGTPYVEYTKPAIHMTRTLVQNMAEKQSFVYMSTQYVELRELTNYENAKLEGEKITETYATNRKVDYRIIRPGFIYGRWDYHHLPLFKMINRLGWLFPMVGNGKNIVYPTYIDDVIDLTVNAFDYQEKILRVCGVRMSMRQFLGFVAYSLGKHPPVYRIPAIGIEPLKTIFKTNFFTSDQAHFRTVISPTPFSVGLDKCIDWYKGGK